jgi:16S rRNA processing protein RimM
VSSRRSPSGDGADEDIITDDGTTWVRIGVVGRPHGVKGGAHLRLDNPESTLLEKGLPIRLHKDGRAPLATSLTDVYGPGLARLEGVDGRDAIAARTGDVIYARRDDFPPADDDEAYLVDLVGAEVRHVEGRPLGEIVAFSDNGAQILAEVRRAGGGPRDIALVPFVPAIVVDIDEEARVVTLDPPEGLIDGEALVAGDEEKS